MIRLTPRILAVAAALLAAASAASAREQRPWCLIYQDWGDGWACAFDTFEQCREEARPGNSGFCAANPAYQAPAPAKPQHRRHKAR
jgi:hypothetical protein